MFDKNGNSTETTTVTVHGFDLSSREYTCTYDVRVLEGTGIPGLSTLCDLPEVKAGSVRVFGDGQWQYVEDNRGITVYSTTDRTADTVSYLGEIKEGFVKTAPATDFDSWTDNGWVTDEAALKASLIASAGAEKERKTDEANAYISSKQWPSKLALGRLTDAEKVEFNLWLDYLDALAAVDTSAAPDINWPTAPAS